MTIVLCSKGYPYEYKKNKLIKNLDKIDNKKKSIPFPCWYKSERWQYIF